MSEQNLEKVKGGNALKKRQINVVPRMDSIETRIYECKDVVGHALYLWSTMNACSHISSFTHFPRFFFFGAVTQQVTHTLVR